MHAPEHGKEKGKAKKGGRVPVPPREPQDDAGKGGAEHEKGRKPGLGAEGAGEDAGKTGPKAGRIGSEEQNKTADY